MQHEYYHYLVTLVESGSLSEAAELLYMSPQGLSRAMKQMSNELGVNIFYRNKDGLQLTSAGKAVYDAAKEMQTIDYRLENLLFPNLSNPKKNELTVYASAHIHIAYLHKCIKKYYKQNVQSSIRLMEMSLWDIPQMEDIPANSIRLFSVLDEMKELFYEDVNDDCYVGEFGKARVLCSVSNKSPLSYRASVPRESLSGHKLALFSTEYDMVDVVFGEDETFDISVLATNYNLKCQMIANDTSMIGFSDSLLEQNAKFPAIAQIPIEPELHTVYGYIVPRDIELSPEVKSLINIIKEEFE